MDTNHAPETVWYLRTAKADQPADGSPPRAVLRKLQREVGGLDWPTVAVLSDLADFARVGTPPGLKAALALLSEGRGEVLAVARLSDLGSTTQAVVDVLQQAQREGWRVVASGGLDSSTVEGRALTKAMAAAALLQRPRVGNLRTPTYIVERVQRERRDGRSLRAIADGLNRDGIPRVLGGLRWYASTVSVLLTAAERHAEEARLLSDLEVF